MKTLLLVLTDPGSLLFILWFVYLLWPMKHPCDYNSYQQWWEDKENWR